MFLGNAFIVVANQDSNPHTSPEDVAEGKRVYLFHCAECHGPSLSRGQLSHAETEEELFRPITQGIPGTERIGTWDSKDRVWQLIAYLRSLNPATDRSRIPGDPAKGKVLFHKKSNCLECHRVGRVGGYAGPDLSTVGSSRSLAHLRASILKPNEEVNRRYWVATVRALKGTPTTGFVLNEDAHSIQLLDFEGELRSFNKSGLDDISISRISVMQPYGELFDEDELRDIVSYLASLRKARSR